MTATLMSLALVSALPRASIAGDVKPLTYTVAAIGDSLTEGRTIGGGYMAQLAERCPSSTFDNYGKGGQLVRRMRSRFVNDVFGADGQRRYSHVIVFGGVNDILSDETDGRTVADIERDLSEMYGAARSRGTKVIAVTLSPWGAFKKQNPARLEATLQLNRWIRGQRDSGAVDNVIDAYELLSCGDAARLCPEYAPPFKDGLHFGREGHRKLADLLSKQIFHDCR